MASREGVETMLGRICNYIFGIALHTQTPFLLGF